LELVSESEIMDTLALSTTIKRMELSEIELQQLSKKKSGLQQESDELDKNIKRFVESYGGKCPTCGNTIGDRHAQH